MARKKKEEGGAMIIYSHTVRQTALGVKQGTDICTSRFIQTETAEVSHQNIYRASFVLSGSSILL